MDLNCPLSNRTDIHDGHIDDISIFYKRSKKYKVQKCAQTTVQYVIPTDVRIACYLVNGYAMNIH
jgi:hypothetical protein